MALGALSKAVMLAGTSSVAERCPAELGREGGD